VRTLYHPHTIEVGQVYEIRRGVPYHWRVEALSEAGHRVTLYFDGKRKTISLNTLRKDYWRVDS